MLHIFRRGSRRSSRAVRRSRRLTARRIAHEALEDRRLLAADAVGLFAPDNSVFFLRHENSAGPANEIFGFGPPGAGWVPLSGDWNGDGTATVGFYEPNNSVFFLKNENSGGAADVVFSFGPDGAGWQPVVGDWNGDGVDTIGLYSGSAFFLRNNHQAGPADLVFAYGPDGADWTPLAGDWNGNGVDTIGLYSGETFFLRNSTTPGAANEVFTFGPAGAGWTPIAGDFNGDQIDTIGLYSGGGFFLQNAHVGGAADVVFAYGPANAGWRPMVGDWVGERAEAVYTGSISDVHRATIGLNGCTYDHYFSADITLTLLGSGTPGDPYTGNLLVLGDNEPVFVSGPGEEACDISDFLGSVTLDRAIESNGSAILVTDSGAQYEAVFAGIVSPDGSEVNGTLSIVVPLAGINMTVPFTLERQ